MELTLIRHATLIVALAGERLLVDPMLADAGVIPAVPNTPNQRPNPLVPLPLAAERVLDGVTGLVVTHLHGDHLDTAALELLSRDLPLVCQPEDEARLREHGFTAPLPAAPEATWRGIRFSRTGGQHGTGEIAKRLAPVSGFVVEAPGEPSLYVAGDTVWCAEVAGALAHHRPAVAVVNAGGARFLEGDPITMPPDDVVQVCRAAPQARVVAVHMEAINHCVVTRDDLRRALAEAGLVDRVAIPVDGERLGL